MIVIAYGLYSLDINENIKSFAHFARDQFTIFKNGAGYVLALNSHICEYDDEIQPLGSQPGIINAHSNRMSIASKRLGMDILPAQYFIIVNPEIVKKEEVVGEAKETDEKNGADDVNKTQPAAVRPKTSGKN